MTPQEAKEKEAAFVRRFTTAESDLYEWFQFHLASQRDQLGRLVGRMGLSAEDRAVLAGKLSVIQELLDKPTRLLTLAEHVQAEVEAAYIRTHAPQGTPTAL